MTLSQECIDKIQAYVSQHPDSKACRGAERKLLNDHVLEHGGPLKGKKRTPEQAHRTVGGQLSKMYKKPRLPSHGQRTSRNIPLEQLTSASRTQSDL